MSINNISNLGASYSFCTQNKLSEETKRKLQALGIDATNVTSEAQAQMLITAAQSRQQVQKTDNTSTGQETTCSSELELITKAKTLASKMGVSVSQNSTMTEILTSLSNKISTLTAQTGNDKTKSNEIQQFRSELTSLENEYSTLTQSQNSIFSAMNMSANLNKLMLGLN